MRELIARQRAMRVCCEKCGRPYQAQAEKDGLMLTVDTVWHCGQSVRLAIRPAEIVQELLKTYPELVSRERLFSSIWGGASDVDDKIVDVYLCAIRKKLATIGLGIESVWGVGFRLIKK